MILKNSSVVIHQLTTVIYWKGLTGNVIDEKGRQLSSRNVPSISVAMCTLIHKFLPAVEI